MKIKVFNKALQHRSASLHWTVFKLRFCEFAAQILSQKRNLKTAAELNVRFAQELRMSINKEPDWVTRGKIVSGLIKELGTFENKNLVVNISLDDSRSTKEIIAV